MFRLLNSYAYTNRTLPLTLGEIPNEFIHEPARFPIKIASFLLVVQSGMTFFTVFHTFCHTIGESPEGN